MLTLLYILIAFVLVLLLLYIFFESKQDRLQTLLLGTCPDCAETKTVFVDKNTNTTFTQEVIFSKVLRKHGCSGINEVEFTCKSCDLKEIHSINSSSNCGI